MRAILRFVMNATMPAYDDMPGNKDTKIDAFLDEFAANAAPIIRLGFYAAAVVYVISPIITLKVPLPAFLLSSEKQVLHMEKYSESRNVIMAQLWMLQKMISALCWGMDDAVRAYFGYQPFEGDPGTFQSGVPEILSEAYRDKAFNNEQAKASEGAS